MKYIILALALSASLSAQAHDRVKLYIFTATDPSGFTDEAGKDRMVAVKEAIGTFAKNGKNGNTLVEIVATREEAQLTLEITRRVKEMAKTSIARSMWKNNSWSRSADSLQPFLYGTLTVGTFTTELRSPDAPNHGWQLARLVQQWIKDNRAQLTVYQVNR